MDTWTEIIQSSWNVIGGAAIACTFVQHRFAKIRAKSQTEWDASLQREMAKLNSELNANIQKELQEAAEKHDREMAKLKRPVFVFQAQFEKEFEVYAELTKQAYEMAFDISLHGNSLDALMTEEVDKALLKRAKEFHCLYQASLPFIHEKVFKTCNALYYSMLDALEAKPLTKKEENALARTKNDFLLSIRDRIQNLQVIK